MSKLQGRTFHLIWFACVIYLTENYVLPCQVPGMVLIWNYASNKEQIRTRLKYGKGLTQNILILKNCVVSNIRNLTTKVKYAILFVLASLVILLSCSYPCTNIARANKYEQMHTYIINITI